ncbi:hypothetical protein P3L10_018928 [Capsicum annuum]
MRKFQSPTSPFYCLVGASGPVYKSREVRLLGCFKNMITPKRKGKKLSRKEKMQSRIMLSSPKSGIRRFLLPASLIEMNDVAPYFFGFSFG